MLPHFRPLCSSVAAGADKTTDDQPLTREEAQQLLARTEAIYRSVTGPRRRVATAALILAGLFGVLTLVSGVQWLQTRSQVEQVVDEPLVEALGVEIPDPRPAMERARLRIQALVWGVATAGAAAVMLLFAALHLVARPPAAVRALERDLASGPRAP